MTMTDQTVFRPAPPWRAATLSLLLALSGCGGFGLSRTSATVPGMTVAEEALRGGSPDMALRFSDSVLAASPGNVRALEIRGDALALLGESALAEQVFQELLRKDPDSVRANIGLGRLRVAREPAAAEGYFLTVLKREPKNMIALNNLGICRDLLHRHQDAQTAYRQALAIQPGLESTMVNLALSMAMTGQGDAAAAMLRPRATLDGASVKLKHDYAVVLAMAGHRPEAQRVLGQDMSPAEATRILDSVTATQIRVVRENGPALTDPTRTADEAPAPIAAQVARLAAARRLNDTVPPDVVQPIAAAPAAAPVAAAPETPSILRPPGGPSGPLASDPGPPVGQPTDPILAGAANARMLSASLRAGPKAADAEEADETIAPKVVAMPVAMPMPAAVRAAPVQVAPVQVAPVQTAPIQAAPVQAAPPMAPPPRPVPPRAALPEAAPAQVNAPAPARTVAPVRLAAARIEDKPTATPRADATSQPALVQFAAAPTEAGAMAFWEQLHARFPDALNGMTPVVVRAERNGSTFWRVRAEGPGGGTRASALCAKMRAAGQDCFVPRS